MVLILIAAASHSAVNCSSSLHADGLTDGSVVVQGYRSPSLTHPVSSRIQAAEISVLCRVAGRTGRHRMRSSVIRIERSQLMWFRMLKNLEPKKG